MWLPACLLTYCQMINAGKPSSPVFPLKMLISRVSPVKATLSWTWSRVEAQIQAVPCWWWPGCSSTMPLGHCEAQQDFLTLPFLVQGDRISQGWENLLWQPRSISSVMSRLGLCTAITAFTSSFHKWNWNIKTLKCKVGVCGNKLLYASCCTNQQHRCFVPSLRAER